jgi:hypothetical protein
MLAEQQDLQPLAIVTALASTDQQRLQSGAALVARSQAPAGPSSSMQQPSFVGSGAGRNGGGNWGNRSGSAVGP